MSKSRLPKNKPIMTTSPKIKSGRRNGSRKSPEVSTLIGNQAGGQQGTTTRRKAHDTPTRNERAGQRSRLIDFMRVAEWRYILPTGNSSRWYAADGSIGFKFSLFFADTPPYAAYDKSPADLPVRVLFTEKSMETAQDFICMTGFVEAVGSIEVPDGSLKSRCATDSPASLLEYCSEEEGRTLEAARAEAMLDKPSPNQPLLVLISDTTTVVNVDHADTSSDSFRLAHDVDGANLIDKIRQTIKIREQEALKIDPETAHVCSHYAFIFDEYATDLDLPEDFTGFGKTYFARSQGSPTWVAFAHLPEATRKRLWEKHSLKVHILPE
jgi:hypothetical protein